MVDVAERVERSAAHLAERYRHGHDRPLGSYGALDAVYAAVVAGIGMFARRRRMPVVSLKDVLLLGVATHRVSRTIAKDPVLSPVRMPFTRYEGLSGPSELHEEVVASGAGHAVGELLTCPFCLAQWVATGFAAGLLFAPRATRFAMATMSGVALADFLQLGYAAMQEAAG